MKNYYSLRSYWAYLRRYKLRFFLVMLIFAVSNLALAFIPLLIGQLVEAATRTPVITEDVWRYVILLIISSSLHDITWRAAELSFMKFLMPLPFWYENNLFKTVIQKPYPYFVGKFTGKMASYVTTLRKELEDLLDKIMWEYVRLAVEAIAMVSILFSVNTATGAVFLASIVVLLIVGRFTIRNNIKYEAVYTDIDSTKNGSLIDVMGNFVNVKSFGKELIEHTRLIKEQGANIEARQRSFKWAVVFWGSMSVIVRHMIWPITIIMNVRFFLDGSIGIGELTTFFSVIALFSNNIWDFIWEISQFSLRAARIEEAHRYLFGSAVIDIVADHQEQNASAQGVQLSSELSISQLSFSYPDQSEQKVLENIDLTIKKGEKIGIVGRSGSGKTTLVKLLLGYYPANSGTIKIDGQLLKNDELLQIISYVPQDTTLFNRSITENIAYAVDRSVTQEEIEQVAHKSLSAEFIEGIPSSYEAIVGERGVKLSTGQRQRLSIARAMLQDKPLLILDEATSALDSENEALVQQSLENLWEDRAVISIAHRLSTLKKMDRIIVFDKGRIIEQGTIAQLLENMGAFYDLWNHQVDGMIVE